MKKYDDIIVGSGISGLTLACLLGLNGHKVLIIEKDTQIGGSLKRFFKQEIPFDTGFHFTGGISEKGILYQMLDVLNIRDYIKPVFLTNEKNNKIIFESENVVYELPTGIKNLKEKLEHFFPGEKKTIDKYFEMIEKNYLYYVSTDLQRMYNFGDVRPENFISLDAVLNQLTQNKLLKGLLSAYSLCYGVKPVEISFANHSLMTYNLYQSIARIINGGDSFINAFKECFNKIDIEIMCGKYITDFIDIQDKRVNRFVLSSGDEIAGDRCVFTIHPKEILKILPEKYLKKAFIDRVSNFESSTGFFSVYGIVEEGKTEFSNISIFPNTNLNQIMDSAYKGSPAMTIMNNNEMSNGKIYQTITALELSFPEHVEKWKSTKTGKRTELYTQYKQQHINNICDRIYNVFPEYKNSFKVVDSASILTYRDYLNSSDGSAYGIKQKIGQYNLFGRLPLHNLYAAGQSSVLPGIVGSMISSFIIGREILGKEKYNLFIERGLCN